MSYQESYLSTGEVANTLGWSPRFVDSLVRNEKLPGVEIEGEWKFDRKELIGWLEQKIKTLDHTHVVELENQISYKPEVDEFDPVTLQLSKYGILLDVHIDSKLDLLKKIVELSYETGAISDRVTLLDSLKEREELCSTAFPGGVAICHPRTPLPSITKKPFVRLIRSSNPIAFGAEDLHPTSLFFLLVATDDKGHLQTLARLARILDDPTKIALKAAKTSQEVYSIIEAREVTINRKRQSLLLQS